MNKFDGYIRNIFSEDTLVINVLLDNPSYISNFYEYEEVVPVHPNYKVSTPMSMDMCRHLVEYIHQIDSPKVVVLQVDDLHANAKQLAYIVNEIVYTPVYITCAYNYAISELNAIFLTNKPIIIPPAHGNTKKFAASAKSHGFVVYKHKEKPKYITEDGKVKRLFRKSKQPRVYTNVCHAGITVIPSGKVFTCPSVAISGHEDDILDHVDNSHPHAGINPYATCICACCKCKYGLDIRVMNMNQHSEYSRNRRK